MRKLLLKRLVHVFLQIGRFDVFYHCRLEDKKRRGEDVIKEKEKGENRTKEEEWRKRRTHKQRKEEICSHVKT